MQQLIDKQNQEISSNVYTTTRTLLIGNNGEDTFVKCNIEIDLKNLKIKVTPTKQIPGVDFLKVFKEQTAIALEVGGNEYLVFLKKTSEGSLQLTWRDKNLNKEEIEKFMQEKDETIAKIIMNGRDLDPWVLTITYEQENREFKAKPRFREEEEEEENQLERGEENWFKAKPRFREEEEEEENQLERGEEKESLPKTKENIEKKEEREKRYEQFFKFYELDWLKEENKELIRNYLDKCLEKNEKKLGTFTQAIFAEVGLYLYKIEKPDLKEKVGWVNNDIDTKEKVEKELADGVKKLLAIKESFYKYYDKYLNALKNNNDLLDKEIKDDKIFGGLYSTFNLKGVNGIITNEEKAAILAFYKICKENKIRYKEGTLCLYGLNRNGLDCDLMTKLLQELFEDVGIEGKVALIYKSRESPPNHALYKLGSKEIYIETTSFLAALGGDGEQILNAVTDKEGFSDIHAGKYLSITKYLLDIENSYMLMKLYIGSLKDLLTSMIKEKDNLNITKYIQENPITYAEETYNLEIVSNLLNNIEESLYISKINNRLKERGMTEDMIIKRLKKEYEVEIKSNGD